MGSINSRIVTAQQLSQTMERCNDKIHTYGGPVFEEEWNGIRRALTIPIDPNKDVFLQLREGSFPREVLIHQAIDRICLKAYLKSALKFFKKENNDKQI